jgi:diguanylate cyclase (GGDEF)-like protein
MLAPIPHDEEARLADLHHYRIVDTGPEESFDRIARLACAMAQTPVALISLIDRDRQWFKSHIGLQARETPREMAFCAHAILEDGVMVVEDATRDARFACNSLVRREGGIRFYAGAPIKSPSGHRLGTLCVIDRIPRRIDPRMKEMLKDMAAMVVSEMELRKVAGKDGLTGLFNRDFIDDLAQREMNRARRMSQPLTVALIDADKFASLNEIHGHATGDTVLRRLAEHCIETVRSHDLAGRYGGEEFLLLLPNTTLHQSATVLERLRLKVANMPVPELTDRPRVTVSIGASEMEPRDADIGVAIARADMALHRAKEAGRDRVVFDAAA